VWRGGGGSAWASESEGGSFYTKNFYRFGVFALQLPPAVLFSPLLITGTDTPVGKTYVAAGLIRAARAAGIDCVGFKPIL
jgi:hypothetical protein